MNWFQQNKFLAGFLVVLAVALGGAGYYLLSSHSKYKTSKAHFDSERSKLKALESRPLYPSQGNVERISASVSEYKRKVLELQSELLRFQKPLNTALSNQEFPPKLKGKIAEFEKVAEINGVKLPSDFYFGFPTYRLDVPMRPAVPLLDYQLEAVAHMLNLLAIETGVEEIISLTRERLPIEAQDFEAPENTPVMEKYPFELTFTSTHAGVQTFFNRLSNDDNYFYVLRFIQVENETKIGPSIESADTFGASGDDRRRMFELETADDADAAGPGDIDVEANDAEMILGQEKIQVYAVIDLVRFEEVKMDSEKSDTAR